MNLTLNDRNKEDFLTAAKWAKVLSIFGFIGIAFILFAALVIFVGGEAIMQNQQMSQLGIPPSSLAILYLMIAVFYYFPVSFMYKMSKSIRSAIDATSQEDFNLGIGFLAKFFKFSGYMTIGIIVMYFVVIIGAMFVAISAAFT